MGLRYLVAFLSHIFSLMYMNFSIFCMSTYIHLYWYRDEQYVYIYMDIFYTHIIICVYTYVWRCVYIIYIIIIIIFLLLLKPLFAIAEIWISPEQKYLLQLPFQLLGKLSISFDKYSNFLSIWSFIWCLLKSPFAL